jgi:hypothetical protein
MYMSTKPEKILDSHPGAKMVDVVLSGMRDMDSWTEKELRDGLFVLRTTGKYFEERHLIDIQLGRVVRVR